MVIKQELMILSVFIPAEFTLFRLIKLKFFYQLGTGVNKLSGGLFQVECEDLIKGWFSFPVFIDLIFYFISIIFMCCIDF